MSQRDPNEPAPSAAPPNVPATPHTQGAAAPAATPGAPGAAQTQGAMGGGPTPGGAPPQGSGPTQGAPAAPKRSVLDAVSKTADYNQYLSHGPALPFGGLPAPSAPFTAPTSQGAPQGTPFAPAPQAAPFTAPTSQGTPFAPAPQGTPFAPAPQGTPFAPAPQGAPFAPPAVTPPPLAPSSAYPSPPLVSEPQRGPGLTVGQSTPTTPSKTAPGSAQIAPTSLPREVVELVFHTTGALSRVRTHPSFSHLLGGAQTPGEEELYDELPAGRRPSAKDRADILAILTRAPAIGPEGVASAALTSTNEWGAFTPALAVVAGELEFPFEELETLRATVAVVTPLASSDKKLAETIDQIHETFKLPWASSAPAVVEWLSNQLREAIAPVRQRLGARYIESAVERMLLGQRHYQKRVLLGQQRIRALLSAAGSSIVLPAYLPDVVARELPAVAKARVKMLAEIRPQMDQGDSGPWALRVVALGRLIAR